MAVLNFLLVIYSSLLLKKHDYIIVRVLSMIVYTICIFNAKNAHQMKIATAIIIELKTQQVARKNI